MYYFFSSGEEILALLLFLSFLYQLKCVNLIQHADTNIWLGNHYNNRKYKATWTPKKAPYIVCLNVFFLFWVCCFIAYIYLHFGKFTPLTVCRIWYLQFLFAMYHCVDNYHCITLILKKTLKCDDSQAFFKWIYGHVCDIWWASQIMISLISEWYQYVFHVKIWLSYDSDFWLKFTSLCSSAPNQFHDGKMPSRTMS